VPDDLIEAARIDGAGHGRIFRHVFLPLSRPVLINLAALSVMWSLATWARVLVDLMAGDPAAAPDGIYPS
jgi:alpha-glucoside transport system permease protein